ncbi:MAG: hypothetical protein H7841_02990 [Magnetospirillum sp. WYHS-4]
MKRYGVALTLALCVWGASVEANEVGVGRYQIMKATETTAWRLDTKTGEIVACRFEEAGMVCGSTETAVARGKTSYQDYKAEKEADRKTRQAEELAFFERVIGIFKSLVAFFMEQEKASAVKMAPECPK